MLMNNAACREEYMSFIYLYIIYLLLGPSGGKNARKFPVLLQWWPLQKQFQFYSIALAHFLSTVCVLGACLQIVFAKLIQGGKKLRKIIVLKTVQQLQLSGRCEQDAVR
jgi:hypothetical protein